MPNIIKFRDRKGIDQIMELVRCGRVQFDTKKNWMLVGKPIGGKHRKIFWVSLDEVFVDWIRGFSP